MESHLVFRHGCAGIRDKLNQYGPCEVYAVDSEVSKKVTYVERDGEFAIVSGCQSLQMSKAMWQELVQVLNERNLTKYGIRPEM